MRRMRIVESPDDLVALYADAQTSVTYDVISGRFYYPALGLYLDPTTSMFYDPATGTYRDVALQGVYDRTGLGEMYYDATTGLFYDAMKKMSYNPATGLYHDGVSGLDLSYDNQVHAFFDPVAGMFYDLGLATHLIYDYGTGLFHDDAMGLDYDAERGLYFSRELGFYYDRRRGLYYDTKAELYFDPFNWVATVDPHRRLRYDEATGYYFCAVDGMIYSYDGDTDLYCWIDNEMGWRQHYYDPMSGDHFIREDTKELTPYIEEIYGNVFDPASRLYFDKASSTYYLYDTMGDCYVDVMNRAPFIPGLPIVPASPTTPPTPPVLFEETGYPGVTYEIATGLYWNEYDGRCYISFDPELELFADDGMSMMGLGQVVYYEPKTGFHLIEDTMPGVFIVQETGDTYDPVCGYFYDNYNYRFYRYDYSMKQFCDTMSGSTYRPAWMSWMQWSPPGEGSGSATPNDVPIDTSNMVYDAMIGMYYDSNRGMYYDNTAVLYYDGMSYYDPWTWESYCHDEMVNVFINNMTGKTYEPPAWSEVNLSTMVFDPMGEMYYDPSRGIYFDTTSLLYYDYEKWYDPLTWEVYRLQNGIFVSEETGRRYIPLVHTVVGPPPDTPGDPLPDDPPRPTEVDISAMAYDEETGMYYDAKECLYYNATAGLYYDSMLNCYYDPGTWSCYVYDPLWQVYFNADTGESYRRYTEDRGYAEDISRMYYDEMTGMYWDPEREMYYVGDADLYYDPSDYCYYDPVGWERYHYDGMCQQYMNDDTYRPYVPRPRKSDDVVDTAKMFYDELIGLYYDPERGLYYDPGVRMYVEGRYCDATGRRYYYDPEGDVYRDASTGAVRGSDGGTNTSSAVIDLSAMMYDEMMGMYYDYEQGKYFDSELGLYYDGMCYFNPATWERCWYDWSRNAYVSEAGEVYDPDRAGLQYKIRSTEKLTSEELAEINATFKMLTQVLARESEDGGMGMERVVKLNTYHVAPYSAADAVWFYELLGDSVKQVRLRPGVMPLTIEVEAADPWSTMDSGFMPTGMVLPVSQEILNRAVRIPEFTLEPTWNSMVGSLSLVNYNPMAMNYGSMMGGSMMGGSMMGEEIDAEDAAVIEQYAGDWRYGTLFVNAVFRGYWSLYGNGEYGTADRATTIGGLHDSDGDGLPDIEEVYHGTNPLVADTDGDGMNDALEILIGSDPNCYDCDSDYDGMPDVWERYFGFNPFNPVDGDGDPDGDGLRNFEECSLGTNPRNADTDGDGLRDGEELQYGTQPCNPDTDNDQLSDGAEIVWGTNPFNPDTDLDDVSDGAEVGLGLDPLCVDTDGDGIADSDEIKYGLVGLSVLEKDQLELVRRLRNWQPTDVGDLDEDVDFDGIPDWLEVLGGSRPFGDLDVFKRQDGFPAVFKLTITLEEPLAKPICLDVNGAKICLKEARTVERWCREGELYRLNMVGRQGTDAKISYTFEDTRYKSEGIFARLGHLFGLGKKLPAASNANEHSKAGGKFYEASVKISPDPICFHGDNANPEQSKTLVCEVEPKTEAVAMETRWWVSGHEDQSEHLFGSMVNVKREHVGSTVYCQVMLSLDNGKGEYVRRTQQHVYECHEKDTDAQQHDWCTLHERERSICREEYHVAVCRENEQVGNKVEYLPITQGTSGGGDNTTSAIPGTRPPNDKGLPYFTGLHAATSVAYNSDDDNSNKSSDLEETAVKGEDDLEQLSPIWPGHGVCCPCPEHVGSERFHLTDLHGVAVWGNSDKRGAMLDCLIPLGTKGFVEGCEISGRPDDARFCCTLESYGQSAELVSMNRTFTVYSVRLVPDLNRDGMVDSSDAALMPVMQELGIGWNIDAKRRFAFKLLPEVRLNGELKLKVSRNDGSQAHVAIYATKDAGDPLIGTNEPQKEHSVLSRGCGSLAEGDVFWIEALGPEAIATLEAEFTGTGDAEGYNCHVKLKVVSSDFRIAGDGGIRDRKIDFDDPADTNIVFWVNDDYDVIRWNDGLDEKDFQEDDDKSLCKDGEIVVRNCDDDVIGMRAGVKNQNYDEITTNGVKEVRYCLRDLEDFDRLYLKVGKQLLGNDKLKFEFQFKAEEGKNCPAINIFEAVDDGDFYLRGIEGKTYTGSPKGIANQKKRDIATLEAQMEIRKAMTVDQNGISPKEFVMGEHNYFLYEGKACGTGHLEARVRYGNMILAETSLKMQLEEARAFTEVYQIHDTDLTDAAYTNEFLMAVADVEPQAASAQMPGHNDKELVLLVLGWNVEENEKYAWNDMIFKRLFWHGYHGRVGSFIWPCQRVAPGAMAAVKDPANFDRSEHRAWLSAVKAAELFHQLVQNGVHLTLIAHSQGNILAGEALRRMSREDKDNITYLAWQGAISAQMYTTKYDVTTPGYRGNMAPESWVTAMAFVGETYEWLKSIFSNNQLAPDLFGHYPDGAPNNPPYLNGALEGLRYSVNFYNRGDYALNVWLGNHATRPDNLRKLKERLFLFDDDLCFGYRTGTVWHKWENQAVSDVGKDDVGRFYQMRNGKPMVIYPGSRSDVNGDEDGLVQADQRGEAVVGGETAKWCAFSFVVKSRSLAIGQVNMDGVFGESVDLEQRYKLTKRHYGHSYQFRSNIGDTWNMWEQIIEGINHKKQQENQ